MNISHLQEFVTFSRYMSVTEAARHLHIAQSTLSNHIAAMERAFGCDLVSRGKTMRLTAAGRELVSYASEIVEINERMHAAVSSAGAEECTLVVANEAAQNCSQVSFMHCLTEFLVRQRNVNVQMGHPVATSARATLDGGADCVVVSMGPLDEDVAAGLAYRELPALYPNRLVLWMSTRNPLCKKNALGWPDLSGKYPMAIESPLWAAGIVQFLKDRGVDIETRTNAQGGLGSMLAVKDDEVVLLDELTAASPYVQSIPGHVCVPVDELDAYCRSYLAYDPEKVGRGLRLLLEHLECLTQADGKGKA